MVTVILLIILYTSHSRAQDEGDLRLAGFSTSGLAIAGRLEVFLKGGWGTVCNNGFGTTEAEVACRQIGFISSVNVRRFGNVGELGLPPIDPATRIWLDNVDCGRLRLTSNDYLLACSHSGAGVVDCDHSQDVAVECAGPFVSPDKSSPQTGDLRLYRSSTMDIGRLEIYLQGEWHTVCYRRFGQTEADVACRQLGFSSASRFSLHASDLGTPLASGTSIVRWRDTVECRSSDRTLLSCAHSAGSVFSCDAFQDVTIECTGGSARRNDGDLRLVGDELFGIRKSRRLEMYLQGKWGTVCSHGFSETEAEVACRQLGYTSVSSFGGASEIGSPFFSPNPPVEIWFSNVQCGCSDEKLLTCSNSEDISGCTHRDDVALICRNRTFDEPPANCTDTRAIGIAIGVLIPALILLLVIICVACKVVCKRRNKAAFRSTRASTATAAVTEQLPRAAPYSQTTSHSPTSHPPLPQQFEQPLPQSTLQEAPPPTYEHGVTFPLSSHSIQADPPPPPYCKHQDSGKSHPLPYPITTVPWC